MAPPTPSPASRTTRGRATELLETTCSCLPRAPPGAENRTPAARCHRRSHTTRPGPGRPVTGGRIYQVRARVPLIMWTIPFPGWNTRPFTPVRRPTSTRPPPPRCIRSPGRRCWPRFEDGWADPDRLYAAGRRAQQLREAAQAVVAECLGVRPDEVSFLSSGTAGCARRRPGWPRRAGPGGADAGPLGDRALGGAARRAPGTAPSRGRRRPARAPRPGRLADGRARAAGWRWPA